MAKKITRQKVVIDKSSGTATSPLSSGPKTTPKAPRRSKKKIPTTSTVPAAPGPLKTRFPIVGIGASAGGLDALTAFLTKLRADTGLAFVVVTHQHPAHTNLLPELLANVTDMPVHQVIGGTKVEPNHLYVAPPGVDLAILDGTLHRMETDKIESPRLPIDYFFRSLAEDQKERAICIILSGAGTDGTLGLREIKAQSGMAMVEQPQSAKYAGMPSSAIATGLVDYVLPPAAMPRRLVAYAKGPFLQGTKTVTESLAVSDEVMQKVLVLLRSCTGNDFSSYKTHTLRRRIERRMNVHLIEEPREYLSYLRANAHELDVLFQELLINVTSFFRDPDAWAAIGPHLQNLTESRPDDYTLRAWVPGCATGEEAYSLTILLRECMDELRRPLATQIFGTDLDINAIDAARIARYTDGIRADVMPRRLAKYFARNDGRYGIHKDIRDMVIFAVRNVVQDPPFMKLDVISCRNLLIYMNSDLQDQLMSIFHYALQPDGLLFLGPSETIGSSGNLFEPLDNRWKIFRRKASTADRNARPTRHVQVKAVDEGTMTASPTAPSSNEPRQAISATRQRAATDTDSGREGDRVMTNSESRRANLNLAKRHEADAEHDLASGTSDPMPRDTPASTGKSRQRRKKLPDADRTEQLEKELQHTRESNRASVEESQTLNEELESLNEELTMVNAQLQSKLNEFVEVNNDLQNLLNSTDIATMFLDAHLNIRRYTDEMTRLVMLRPADVGRPIFELASNLKYDDLAADCRQVLRTLIGKESILYTTAGAGYLMRIVPYRTTENVTDGLVLTFIDIERLVRAARETELSGDPFKQIVQTMRHPLLMLDEQLRVLFVNDVFCGAFQTIRDATEGRVIYELGDGQWDIPELRRLLEEILPQNTSLNDYEVKADFPVIGRREMLLNARRIARSATLPAMIVLAIEDVTEKNRITAE